MHPTARRAASAALLAALSVAGFAGPASAGYVVGSGETLTEIAASSGTTVVELVEANGLADADRIVAGAELTLPPGAVPPGGASDPAVRDAVGALLRDAAARHGWRPAVPMGLAMVESGWNNGVVADRGAVGIMQVMPQTEAWLEAHVVDRDLDLADHADNVEAGMAYLDWLYRNLDRDVDLALAAYYEGYGRVSREGPSAAAQHYAATVLAAAADFR